MTIVVGIDGSAGGGAALRWAAGAAKVRGEVVRVVHGYRLPVALAGMHADPKVFEPELHSAAEQLLDEALAEAGDALAGIRTERRTVSGGGAAPALLAEVGADDLLVVGQRGAGGFKGLRLGSVSEHCARHASCPVVVVPAGWVNQRSRIVVGVDGSEESQAALRWAIAEAAHRSWSLTAVQAYLPFTANRPFGAEFMAAFALVTEERLREQAQQGLDVILAGMPMEQVTAGVTSHVGGGDAADVLLSAAQGAALLVVGSRGLGGFSGLLLGSTSRKCLHHADCPVVVVRAKTLNPRLSPRGAAGRR